MMHPTRQLAIMKNVGYGNRDVGSPCLWFDVTLLNGGALIVLHEEDAHELIKKSGVYDIKALEGMPCIVTTDDNIVKFVGLHK